MSTPAAAQAQAAVQFPGLRTNSLAIAFQDVITVILRVRYRVQRVSDANVFRENIRKMIQTATNDARSQGYTEAAKMALYAIVAFLDESVLNSQDPAFQDWSRQPLQEEMFGGHFAGEYFFQHLGELLNGQDSPERADALELHVLCLLLGYRGKYALGDGGQVANIIRQCRAKIDRTRGPLLLIRPQPEQPVVIAQRGDPWIKRLVIISAAVAVLTLVAFAGYIFLLSGSLSSVQTAAAFISPARALVSLAVALRGGLAL